MTTIGPFAVLLICNYSIGGNFMSCIFLGVCLAPDNFTMRYTRLLCWKMLESLEKKWYEALPKSL